MNLISYITEGGPVMYVLTLVSVLALALCLYKIYHFWRLGVWSCCCIEEALGNLRSGDVTAASQMLADCQQPCAKVTKIAIDAERNPDLSKADGKVEIARLGAKYLREMEQYLRGLSVIAQLAPLLGLLGTVTGMITAFIMLEQSAGAAGPELLAGGIWSALLTTAFGLSIAIPTQAVYYFLESQVDKVQARMADAVTQVSLIFNQQHQQQQNNFQS